MEGTAQWWATGLEPQGDRKVGRSIRLPSANFMNEKYKCMNEKCGVEFEAPVGPTGCSSCESRYVQWVSYEQWVERKEKESNEDVQRDGS